MLNVPIFNTENGKYVSVWLIIRQKTLCTQCDVCFAQVICILSICMEPSFLRKIIYCAILFTYVHKHTHTPLVCVCVCCCWVGSLQHIYVRPTCQWIVAVGRPDYARLVKLDAHLYNSCVTQNTCFVLNAQLREHAICGYTCHSGYKFAS